MNLLIVPNKDRIERTGIAISSKPDQVSQRFPDPLDGKPHHRLQRGTDLRGGGVERIGDSRSRRHARHTNAEATGPKQVGKSLGLEAKNSRVSVRPASPIHTFRLRLSGWLSEITKSGHEKPGIESLATSKANQQRLSTALSTLANLFGWVALLALASWPLWI